MEPRTRPEPPGERDVGRTAASPAPAGGPGAEASRSGVRTAGRAVGRAAAYAGRRTVGGIRRLTHAHGMGETGLSRLVELHAAHMAGDAAMAVGLAGTLFFAATTSQARDQVALALLVTMAPFAVVAPLIGPVLDRLRRGRRWAIGATMAARAFLCWVLAGAVATDQWWLYPVAFGCLVASKAYNVTRSSAVPRLLPDGVTLVRANSRISLAGTVGTIVGGGLAAAAATVGPPWALRVAFAVFAAGTVLAILLPPRVDSSAGEAGVHERSLPARLRGMPAPVVLALRCNAALRAYSGFLLLFLAFLLRDQPLAGLRPIVLLAGVAGAAGLGAAVGIAVGSLLRARRPDVLVRVVLALAAVAATYAAVFYGLVAVGVAAFAAGLCQQLGKLALDALVQGQVPEQTRTSVFARAETLIQLSWVIGGGIGIALPLVPRLGLAVCAIWLSLTLLLVVWPRRTGAPHRPPVPDGA